MADLTDDPIYIAAVHEIGIGEAVLGGDGNPANLPHDQMNNRIVFLKQEQDALKVLTAGLIIDTPKTINVKPAPGAGEFSTVQAAWDSLNGSVISALVTIKVFDATYSQSIITLSKQPYAELIRIEGNLGTPANVVFNFTPTGGFSDGMICDGVIGLQLAGFKLQGALTETRRLLQITNGAVVFCDPGKIVMDIADVGLSVLSGFCDFQDNFITGIPLGVFAQFSSHCNVNGCNFTGTSIGVGSGVLVLNNAIVEADNMVVSTVKNGFETKNAGVLICRGTTATGCEIGYLASSGEIICAGATSSGHTGFGFRTSKHGNMNGLADATFATACLATSAAVTSQVGFSADQHSFMVVDGATAVNQFVGFQSRSLSNLQAFNSTVTTSTTAYDPAVTGFDGTLGTTLGFS